MHGGACSSRAPFVRARLLQYAVTTLEQEYRVRVEAARLDYNLVSLRAGLAGVRVSAAGKQPPFFEADYVEVSVPRRTLFTPQTIRPAPHAKRTHIVTMTRAT